MNMVKSWRKYIFLALIDLLGLQNVTHNICSPDKHFIENKYSHISIHSVFEEFDIEFSLFFAFLALFDLFWPCFWNGSYHSVLIQIQMNLECSKNLFKSFEKSPIYLLAFLAILNLFRPFNWKLIMIIAF